MKKINNKGFMLTEALIVSTIVISVLIFLYAQIRNIMDNYDNSFKYNNIDNLYSLNNIKKYIQKDALKKLEDNLTNYIDITDCSSTYFSSPDYCSLLLNSSNVTDLVFTDADLINVKASNTLPQDIQNYINYMEPNNLEGVYYLIAKFNDSEFGSIVLEGVTSDTTNPSTPTLASVTLGNSSITAVYTPSYDLESGISYYTCYYGLTSNPNISHSSADTKCTFDDLIVGTKYYFKICATNAAELTSCSTISNDTPINTIYSYGYTGSSKTFIAPATGTYKIELWGAEGANGTNYQPSNPNDLNIYGGDGAYTAGEIELTTGQILYVFVGEKGVMSTIKREYSFNGGGYSGTNLAYAGSGGGATDIRLTSGNWGDTASIKTRIMVAAGGGSPYGFGYGGVGGDGGGLLGYNGTVGTSSGTEDAIEGGIGGNQITGGDGGQGTSSGHGPGQAGSAGYGGICTSPYGGGGGGGYYGGGAGGANSGRGGGGAGGSSFISGHTGCVAVTSGGSAISGCISQTTDHTCSIHYSTKVFMNTVMIDGSGYAWTNTKGSLERMPNPMGGYYAFGAGHAGNGYARITYIGN